LSGDSQAQLARFRTGSLLAGYRLENQIGEGGMAAVFRARDERLGRLVALKILVPALASDMQFRTRFIAESRAAAVVDDPCIIPVYEAGEPDGVLFIAMRLVPGGDLHGVLEREGRLSPERAVGFISPVASALDAAHRTGLVHRDVKPANILVDAREDRPDHVYLSDFGVSKIVSSAGLTGPGFFVGTPHYAAPEQVQGLAVDGRADQYALACVTFQLLAGKLPFRSDEARSILQEHVSTPPPPLTASRPDLPGAVDQVLARAMAKAPAERYASCLDFADALREALGLPAFDPDNASSGPAAARPAASSPDTVTLAPALPRPRGGRVGRPGHITAWVRGHRRSALALACAILAAAGATAFALQGQVSSPAPKSAGPSPSQAKSLAAAGHPSPEASASTGEALGYSRVGVSLPSLYAGRSILGLALSPSGETLAIAGIYVCLWNIASSTDCATSNAVQTASAVAFSPDGKTVAVGGAPGVYLINANTAKLIADYTIPGSMGVNSVAFSPDGRMVAAGDQNGRSYLWDAATGKLTAAIADPGSQGVKSLAFSPDSRTLAVGDFNGRAYLWDAVTGKLAGALADPGGKGVNSVAFSPRGPTVATGDFDGRAYLWDAATRKLTATITDPGSYGVNSVAFSPDGRTLAVGDENGRAYLWDAATGRLAATLIAPGSTSVNAVAFNHSGNTLATGDQSGVLSVWHLG
jgi:serine/threonine protein kinase